MLAEMGFEPTLCQKAVGMFGDDMGAAVAWLTDDQAQHTLPISHYISLYLPVSPYISDEQAQHTQRTQQRSPEWALAEELAGRMARARARVRARLGLGLGLGLGLELGLGLALADELI